MKKLSLKLRLLLWFIGMSVVIFGTAGVVAWQETRGKIDEFFDSYQMLLARQLASTDWSDITPASQKLTNKIIKNIKNAEDEDEAIGFAVFDSTGKMVFHDNENGKNFAFSSEIGRFAKQKVDGDWWWIVRVKSADEQFYIAVGQELEYRSEIIEDMAEEFMLPWLIGLGLLLGIIILILVKEFAPLKKLVQNLNQRPADNLSPLDGSRLPAEIRPMIASMNKQLAQIEELLKRERSFISDSAHELRTPLTALKIQLEVAQLSEGDEKTRKEALEKLGQGIERASRLVEQLLALSRIEAKFKTSGDNDENIDWKLISQQLQNEYSDVLAAKKQQLELAIGEKSPIAKGNSLLCSLLLRNLLDNAIKYSPQNANIKITCQEGVLQVINSGVTVEEKHLQRLSERFFRPAGQQENGSGLGLAIVSKIAAIYGCQVKFVNQNDSFCVTISPF